MQAGDIGVAFDVPSTIDLSTATSISLTVIDPQNNRQTLSMTVGSTPLLDDFGNQVAATHFWATRTTLATDFPTAGRYECQLVATYGGGTQVIASQTFTEDVGERL